jgi:xanthine dehydrogenase YagS FAD-binding subunit
MRPFSYHRASSPGEAAREAAEPRIPPYMANAQFVAGGTTIVDLMKLDVMQPRRLIDINGLGAQYQRIESDSEGLRLGALVRMNVAAEHAVIVSQYPVIAQALRFAASPQIRNMATLGGNVLQRTRCNYFRDPTYAACNKRNPGSGCAALEGVNRKHAVLGVSDSCIATYPGDFAQALVALGGIVEITNADGRRHMPFEDLHLLPGDTPHIETKLEPGDVITSIYVPAGRWTKRSLYLKIRDRESYEFALASAAIALDLREGEVREARIALGGVATKPWRAKEAEEHLKGKALDEGTAKAAAEIAFVSAKTHGGNDYKPELGRRTLVRALMQAAQMEV